MDYTRFTEDLLEIGAEAKLSSEEVLERKRAAVNALYGTDIDLDDATEDDVDTLLAQAPLTEKIDDIIDVLNRVEGSYFDIAEALRVHTGMKLTEAEYVLKDKGIVKFQ